MNEPDPPKRIECG